MQKQVCNLYQQGKCQKGKKCKYLHISEQHQEEQPQPVAKVPFQGPKEKHPKIYKWMDLSKLLDSQEIFKQNQELLGDDFFKVAKQIKNEREKDLLQLFRKYQQSIKFLPQPDKNFLEYVRLNEEIQLIIRFVPTIERKELEFKEQFKERFIEILIQLPNSSVLVLNDSLSNEFKGKLNERFTLYLSKMGLFNGMKYIETHFDEVVQGL